MATLWLDVLDEAIQACTVHGATDLAQRLRHKRARLLDPRLRVLVLGAANHGKSRLVNALLNAPVCAVGDDVTTTVPTVVEYAPEAGVITPRPGEPTHHAVGVPREVLRAGLVLVDTPPLGHHRHLEDLLAGTDVVLFTVEAGSELSTAHVDFLREVARRCPYLLLALTKTDLAPGWRQTAERNRMRLADAGLCVPVLPVSAELRLRAAQTSDRSLNAESGVPQLLSRLRAEVRAKAERLAPHSAAALTRDAVESLVARLRLDDTDPNDAAAAGPTEHLRAVQRRFEGLRRDANRWQTMLADDIADLVSDIEYDLRDRTRRILRTVDEFFDTADPAQVWDSFTPWLEENLRAAGQATFAWLVQRSHWIATRIAGGFSAHRPDLLPESTFWPPDQVFGGLSDVERPVLPPFTVTQKLFTGLRGSYGGVVMFGLLTGVLGLPLINVVSLGAGALFGGKSLRDESGARRARRQAAAKAAAQRHVEDFFLKFSKDCRDVARQVHRTLRDHFTGLAEDLQEELAEQARQAKEVADRDAAALERRRHELRRAAERLTALHRKAQALSAGAEPAGNAIRVAA